MGILTAAKKAALKKMNSTAYVNDLGALLSPCIIGAGHFTTAAGSASQAITVSGCAAGDIVHVSVQTTGVTPRTIVSAIAASGQINVVLSGDPSTDHILDYVVLRVV